MESKIRLSTPDLSGIEHKYITEALNANQVSVYGENLNVFETVLENYLGEHKKVAALSSGTAAIHLALVMAGVKQNDEVLCQSFTFSASANPIAYQGATPVFVDSEPDTWNICPKFLEIAIQDRIANGVKPKAIILVHLYGMPAKMDVIVAIAKKYEIILIEDAAEALGSTYKGQKCGTFGDYGVLSFNGNKIITTSGGGALICKSQEEKSKAIFLATQARDDAPHYQHSHIGYNYRMSNIVAGIGRGQMEVLENRISSRQGMHKFYQAIFNDTKGITVFNEPNSNFTSNHWLSCIVVDESITGYSREKIRLHLAEKNIESRPLWKPMHIQPVFAGSRFYGNGFCENLFKKGLCLPSGSNLTDDDKERIKIALHTII